MRGTKRKCKRLGSKIRKARREKREETNRLRDTGGQKNSREKETKIENNREREIGREIKREI